MPDISKFDEKGIQIEEVRQLLDQLQSIEAVAQHYNVSPRTVTRFIKGKIHRWYCWRYQPPTTTQTIDVKTPIQGE